MTDKRLANWICCNTFTSVFKQTRFTVNVVPIAAKYADRTLFHFDVFGESKQTASMTSKLEDHTITLISWNQIRIQHLYDWWHRPTIRKIENGDAEVRNFGRNEST